MGVVALRGVVSGRDGSDAERGAASGLFSGAALLIDPAWIILFPAAPKCVGNHGFQRLLSFKTGSKFHSVPASLRTPYSQTTSTVDMNVICLEDEALYMLIEQCVARLREQFSVEKGQWIDGTEVMRMLSIKSTTTLQRLRDEGEIRFSQPRKKIIVYDRESVEAYLEKHARETF